VELQTKNIEVVEVPVENRPEEINPLDLLIVLAEHKKTILRTTVAASLLAVLVSFLLPNRYTATARILPPQQNQSLASSLIGQLGSMAPMAAMAQAGLGLKNPNDLYVGMLKSRTVEDALIQSFDLRKLYRDKRMSDARKDLESCSEITLGKEGFISISVEDNNPRRAADLANAYVVELRKVTQSLAVTEAGQRRLFFEQQLEQAKNNLAKAEETLKSTQQTTGIIQLDGQAKVIIESVVTLRAQVAAKEVQLRAMRSFATDQNPDVVLEEQQLAAMRAQLALLEKQSGGDGDIQVATGKVPQAGLEYVRKMRDVKYYETIFELLARQYEAARLDEAKNAAVIQVLDAAIEPDKKSSPRRTLIILGAVVLAFFVSMLWVILKQGMAAVRMDPQMGERLHMLRCYALGKTESVR
jgi:tyrosine-protein kinase Etk/Wzc